jgi:hypothetical protein
LRTSSGSVARSWYSFSPVAYSMYRDVNARIAS